MQYKVKFTINMATTGNFTASCSISYKEHVRVNKVIY
jgi:hypothetical protein